MYRILAIGNSFSEDATCFLHQIAEKSGVESEVDNLFIGGCSLERHWRNIEEDRCEYQLQLNGIKTERYVSVQEMLEEKKFDVIVTQQASGDSGWENTYEPFLGLMINYLRQQTPDTKLFLHQTWAYEAGSKHEHFMRYNRNQQEMLTRLRNAYSAAASRYDIPLIRTGELIQRLRETSCFDDGKHCITRDGFHLDFLYGRYAAALMWAKELMHIDVKENAFVPSTESIPLENVDREILTVIKNCVEGMK